MPAKTKEQLLTPESGPLTVERILEAPVALVWRCITTPEDITRWFFDLKEFKPQPGFEFEFTVEHQGMTYRHLCKVTEVVPQKKIAYTWRYDGHKGDSLVTYELFAEGNRTRLKLTHEGLDSFPDTQSFARKNFERGWNSISSALKDFVDNVEREIFVSRDFDAPREFLWEAMTNPKHVINWWGPSGFTTTIETMDFRVGGDWKHIMRGPDDVEYPNHSVFKEIVKPEKIVYSHGGGRKGGRGVQFVTTWTFEDLAKDKTRVSIRMIFSSIDDRDFVVREHKAIEGGKQTLGRLGEYARKL